MAVSGKVCGMERRVLEAVIYEREPPVARIILNRVDKANTKDAVLVTEVDSCLHEADRDKDIKVVILKANGKGFCGAMSRAGARMKIRIRILGTRSRTSTKAPPISSCGRRCICGNSPSRRSRKSMVTAWAAGSIWAC